MNAKLAKVLIDEGYWPREAVEGIEPLLRNMTRGKFNSHTTIELCDTRTVEYRRGFGGTTQVAELREHAFQIEGGTFYLAFYYEPTHNILFVNRAALQSVTGSLSA